MHLEERIFTISSATEFESVALEMYHYQRENNPVYDEFCRLSRKKSPTKLNEIPFLPIEFFKSKKVLVKDSDFEIVFQSSGTTGQTRSQHYVKKKVMYEASFLKGFNHFFNNPSDYVILALLPNYISQGNSSLIYMVDHLIKLSGNPVSSFVHEDPFTIHEIYSSVKSKGKKLMLIGVAYSLLDLAEKQIDLNGSIIIETGGMKGRRKEISKEELHDILSKGLNVNEIYSEYGMTELLSQAYSLGGQTFSTPPWMKIMCRDINDPFQLIPDDITGGINIIDLANVYSCPFIATQDLGKTKGDTFQVLGRFDNSDIRGCNLLVD
jgi:phenylacetate-coenzyme A ligase PaaK-like adenylate-forming protein